MSEWSHLPNAKHIDWVMASCKENPEAWVVAWGTARKSAWNAAWDATRGAAWDATRGATRGAAWGAARDAAWGAAWDAVTALIAWDDCGYLLDEKPEHVKFLADLGVEAAILLYPASMVLDNKAKV